MSVPSWAEPYIEQMNGDTARGFFWQDSTSFIWYADTQGRSVTFNPKDMSYWVGNSSASDYHTATLGGCTLLTINVTGSENSYSYTGTATRKNIDFANGGNIYGSAWSIWKSNNVFTIQAISAGNPQDTLTFTDTDTTLEGIIGKIATKFKNITLIVNGEDWTNPVQTYTSNGGGATHIAKVTGQLKDLSSNLSDILMVSGGGGGGLLVGETSYSGKEAGGISGSGDNSADQSTGNAFGLGESGTNLSGGGSGLYGGYKGTSAKSGGAGSGYIGNSLLSNKKMVGYNVPTSSDEGTKTESVNEVSASAVSGKPKSGNGFARIKFLRDAWGGDEVPILWAGNSNKMTVQISNSSILFKLYTGDSVTYSFTAYFGSTIYDADNIYVGFLIDTEQELAKPSMVYANASVLSYNQEEPTDAQMADIYTWISPGLPSE